MPQSRYSYAYLGEEITRLLRAIAAQPSYAGKKKPMEWVTSYIADHTGYDGATVYRWRQGRLCPPSKTVEILAQIGKDEAGLDRNWGNSLLRAAGYMAKDAADIVNTIWGTEQIRSIHHNLRSPIRPLIGRKTEAARLLGLLSPRHAAHLISVDGIGGVGKTTLVLEVAHRCLRASTGEAPDLAVPTFDAIIFASAKQLHLTPHGLKTASQAQRTLYDIFHEIARTLDRVDILRVARQDQPQRVRDALACQRTLLFVDNLETMDNKQGVIDFDSLPVKCWGAPRLSAAL